MSSQKPKEQRETFPLPDEKTIADAVAESNRLPSPAGKPSNLRETRRRNESTN